MFFIPYLLYCNSIGSTVKHTAVRGAEVFKLIPHTQTHIYSFLEYLKNVSHIVGFCHRTGSDTSLLKFFL